MRLHTKLLILLVRASSCIGSNLLSCPAPAFNLAPMSSYSTESSDYKGGTHSVAFVTTPDIASSKKIAHLLLEKKLAACINIVPHIISIYDWEGKINEDNEVLMMIKTRTNRVGEVCKLVKENHAYSVAEVISLPIANGNPPYLDWLSKESRNGQIDQTPPARKRRKTHERNETESSSVPERKVPEDSLLVPLSTSNRDLEKSPRRSTRNQKKKEKDRNEPSEIEFVEPPELFSIKTSDSFSDDAPDDAPDDGPDDAPDDGPDDAPDDPCSEANDSRPSSLAKKKKEPKRRIKWVEIGRFKSFEEAKEEQLPSEIWTFNFKRQTKKGEKKIFRCRKVRRRGKQCAAERCVHFLPGTTDVIVYATSEDHTHDEINSKDNRNKMTTEVKDLIKELFREDFTIMPADCREDISRRNMKMPSYSQMFSYIKKLRIEAFGSAELGCI